jgi:hypothetical protein
MVQIQAHPTNFKWKINSKISEILQFTSKKRTSLLTKNEKKNFYKRADRGQKLKSKKLQTTGRSRAFHRGQRFKNIY